MVPVFPIRLFRFEKKDSADIGRAFFEIFKIYF